MLYYIVQCSVLEWCVCFAGVDSVKVDYESKGDVLCGVV